MRKAKRLMSSILAMGMAIALSVPVFADEAMPMSASDSSFPMTFISSAKSYDTIRRSKDNDSYVYVKNTSGLDLRVRTKAGSNGKNYTKNGSAVVPSGEWFVANYINENGYTSCYLTISAANAGASGYLKGKWSPDSVGSYPVANR